MAEIKIEQKKQSWPWVIVVLVIAAFLIYFVVFRNNDNVNETEIVTEENYNSGSNDSNLSDHLHMDRMMQ